MHRQKVRDVARRQKQREGVGAGLPSHSNDQLVMVAAPRVHKDCVRTRRIDHVRECSVILDPTLKTQPKDDAVDIQRFAKDCGFVTSSLINQTPAVMTTKVTRNSMAIVMRTTS